MAKHIGDRVKGLREAQDMSQRELDDLAKITPGHTGHIERTLNAKAVRARPVLMTKRGKKKPPPTVTAETLASIADVFGVSLDWLALGKGETPDDAALAARVAPRLQDLRKKRGAARTGTEG